MPVPDERTAMDYHSEAQVQPGETCGYLVGDGPVVRCGEPATIRIGGFRFCDTHRERMLEWTGR